MCKLILLILHVSHYHILKKSFVFKSDSVLKLFYCFFLEMIWARFQLKIWISFDYLLRFTTLLSVYFPIELLTFKLCKFKNVKFCNRQVTPSWLGIMTCTGILFRIWHSDFKVQRDSKKIYETGSQAFLFGPFNLICQVILNAKSSSIWITKLHLPTTYISIQLTF